MKSYVALFLLLTAAAPSLSRWLNPCLYNREDVLPCTDYARSGVASPRANQYTAHATRFRRNAFGFPVCVLRKEGELVADIEDLGTPDVKFLFSPGAERSPNTNYANQMVVEYNVQCQAGKLAFIQFDSLDLEPKNCYDGTTLRCQDYVEIDAGAGGRSEFCGRSYPKEPLLVGTGKFTLKMRTSFSNSYSGFRISVICFKQEFEEQQMRPNCIDSSDKKGAVELIDLASTNGQTHSSVTLTRTEKKTLENLADSLYTTALRQTRNKIASWPPSSYSRNEMGDILDLSELNEPTPPPINIPILPPVDKIKYPFIDEPIGIQLPIERELEYRRRRSLFAGQDRLNSKATMEAVRNENACNSIIRSVTKSYLRVAQRLEPNQLEKARQDYQLETSQHLNNNLLAAH